MNKRILFITSTRIGDAVLSTGILSYIIKTYPDAKLTIACGPLVETLFQGVPGLERIIPLKKQSWNRHWIKLWLSTVITRWDMVVDLRDSIASRLIPARKHYIFSKHIDKSQHKVEQNAAVINITAKDAPLRLFLTQAQLDKAKQLIPDGAPVLGIGPTANWIGKTWPIENFKELVARLLEQGSGPFAGWRVAVFGAPGEEEVANQLYNDLAPDMRLDLIAKGTPGDAAACLSRCQFYIGNDSGLMHSAAAAGIPTLGLFGPTNDKVYGVYGPRAALVRTPEDMKELIDGAGGCAGQIKKTLMNNLTVDTVERAVRGLLAKM